MGLTCCTLSMFGTLKVSGRLYDAQHLFQQKREVLCLVFPSGGGCWQACLTAPELYLVCTQLNPVKLELGRHVCR